MANRIFVGTSAIMNKGVYLDLNLSETNGHTLLLGESGSGKTYCTQVMVSELARLGSKVYILDLTGSLTRNQGEPEFFSNIGEKLDYVNVAREGLLINLFERIMMDEETLEKDSDLAGRVADSLTACIGRGELQRALVYQCIKAMLVHCDRTGEMPSLELLGLIISGEKGVQAKKVIGKMAQLIDGQYFHLEPPQNMMCKLGDIKLMQMQSIAHSIKQVLTDLILWKIWSDAVRYGSKNHPTYILIDEFQNVRLTPSSPLYKILCEGRKFGLNLILATQFIQGKFSDNVEMAIAQVGNKIFFRPPDKESRYVAGFLTHERNMAKEQEERLRGLRKGEAMIKGDIYFDETGGKKYLSSLKVKINRLSTK